MTTGGCKTDCADKSTVFITSALLLFKRLIAQFLAELHQAFSTRPSTKRRRRDKDLLRLLGLLRQKYGRGQILNNCDFTSDARDRDRRVRLSTRSIITTLTVKQTLQPRRGIVDAVSSKVGEPRSIVCRPCLQAVSTKLSTIFLSHTIRPFSHKAQAPTAHWMHTDRSSCSSCHPAAFMRLASVYGTSDHTALRQDRCSCSFAYFALFLLLPSLSIHVRACLDDTGRLGPKAEKCWRGRQGVASTRVPRCP